MLDPRDSGSPIAPPNMGDSPTPAPLSQTEVQKEDDRFWKAEQLGDGNLPCKNLIDALASSSRHNWDGDRCRALFTVITAGPPFQDLSPEGCEYRGHLIQNLAMSGFMFALATANALCLQALYSSPSFCKILYKKLNRDPKRRTKLELWLSWDFMRYFVAYFAVAWAYTSIGLHLIATMIIFQLFTFNGHRYPAQVAFGLTCFACIVIWVISMILERPKRLRREDISAA
ncbi:hypothetical protein FRC00_013292 [Tulasnella sp. 408]|nr:hypothetical protein FRC00_013292 [Tulasnella sp. 408]